MEAVRSRGRPDLPTGTHLSAMHETDIHVLIFQGKLKSREAKCPAQAHRLLEHSTGSHPALPKSATRLREGLHTTCTSSLKMQSVVDQLSASVNRAPAWATPLYKKNFQGENSVTAKEKSQEYTQCPWYAPGNVGGKPLE